MGFDAAQSVAVEHGQAGDAVGLCPFVDGGQAFDLDLVSGDDDLSALVDGDVVPIGEVEQQRDAATAESGLEAAGLVVETGVDDTGVVAGLMGGRVVFLVEDRDVGAVMTHEDLARHGRADDSGTDHGPACGCHVSTSPLDDLTLRLYSARTNTAIGVRSVVVALPMVVISNAFEIWRSES